MLSKAAREMRAAYQRAWRKANPGRNKQARDRYWERKAAEAKRLAETAKKE